MNISALPPSYSTVRLVRTLEPISPTLPPLPIQESLELSFEATFESLTVRDDTPPPDCPPARSLRSSGPPRSTGPVLPAQSRTPQPTPLIRPVPQRTRSRSASDLPSRTHIEEMHELALELDELPSYAECARDRPPPIGPPIVHVQTVNGVQVRSGRSHSLGTMGWAGPDRSPREGWVRDPDGQWRQGRRRTIPIPQHPNPAHPSNFPPSSRSHTSRSLPSRLGLEPRPGQQHGQILLRPRSRGNEPPAAGNGKVWRKKLGVWYVAKREGFFVETVGPQGERWRRTLGVWHVVGDP